MNCGYDVAVGVTGVKYDVLMLLYELLLLDSLVLVDEPEKPLLPFEVRVDIILELLGPEGLDGSCVQVLVNRLVSLAVQVAVLELGLLDDVVSQGVLGFEGE